MKTQLLLALLLVLTQALLKKKHRKHKSHSHMHSKTHKGDKEKDVRTYNTETTKKFIKSDGSNLRNHYGYAWDESPYAGGPALKKAFLPENLKFKNPDGVWSSPINHNMKPDSLIGEDCDVEQSIYFDHCRSMDRCIVCNGNANCEWCPETEKCNPRIKEGCHCPNVCIDAIDPNRNCNADNVVMGSVDEVAPESQGVKDAIWAPKKIVETQRKFEVFPGETGVPMGQKDTRAKVTFKKEGKDRQFNQLSNEWTTYKKTQYLMVPHDKMTETITKRNIDPETLNEVKFQPEEKVLHGVDPKEPTGTMPTGTMPLGKKSPKAE